MIPFGRTEARLDDIRCPFLNVFCEQDTIVPAAVVRTAHRARRLATTRPSCGSSPATSGLVAGRQAAKVARPQIADWIRRHSDAESRAAA